MQIELFEFASWIIQASYHLFPACYPCLSRLIGDLSGGVRVIPARKHENKQQGALIHKKKSPLPFLLETGILFFRNYYLFFGIHLIDFWLFHQFHRFLGRIGNYSFVCFFSFWLRCKFRSLFLTTHIGSGQNHIQQMLSE